MPSPIIVTLDMIPSGLAQQHPTMGIVNGAKVALSPILDPQGVYLMYYQLPDGSYVRPSEVKPVNVTANKGDAKAPTGN